MKFFFFFFFFFFIFSNLIFKHCWFLYFCFVVTVLFLLVAADNFHQINEYDVICPHIIYMFLLSVAKATTTTKTLAPCHLHYFSWWSLHIQWYWQGGFWVLAKIKTTATVFCLCLFIRCCFFIVWSQVWYGGNHWDRKICPQTVGVDPSEK